VEDHLFSPTSGVAKYFVGPDAFDFVAGSIPQTPVTFYGQVREAYRLQERELIATCNGYSVIKIKGSDNDKDLELAGYVPNASNWGFYADLACTIPIESIDGLHMSVVGNELRVSKVMQDGYLKFTHGGKDIIYKVDLQGAGGVPVPVASASFNQSTNKLILTDWDNIINRTDRLERYCEYDGSWSDVFNYSQITTSGTTETVADGGYYRYTSSAVSCQLSQANADTYYFTSNKVRSLLVEVGGGEFYSECNGDVFTILSADVKQVYLYSKYDLTAVEYDNSQIGRATNKTVTVDRPVDGGTAPASFTNLYRFKIDIRDLKVINPVFRFETGDATNDIVVQFTNHIGPTSADPVDELISRINMEITYLEDPEDRFDEPTVSKTVQVETFTSQAERELGVAKVDLGALGLSATEITRLLPADFVLTHVAPSKTGQVLEVVDQNYAHEHLGYYKITVKNAGWSSNPSVCYIKFTYQDAPADLRNPTVIEKPVVLNDLFFNHTLVGQVIKINSTQPLIVQPGLRFEKGSRLIVEEITDDVLYEGLDYTENRNWIRTVGRDDYGQIRQDGKIYFNESGQLEQAQSKNFENHLVMASMVIADELGRPAVQTLSAPIRYGLKDEQNQASLDERIPGYDTYFEYDPNFVDANKYNHTHFTGDKTFNPDPLTDNATPGTLGWYYSANNNGQTNPLGEDYVAQTQYPYSRTIFYEDVTGEVMTTVPAGDYIWKS
ncbi:hypothetical protein, partial [Reichenbachiella sp.]|uniref:hypothetical protein n=1 Tax=Reichenbachiella sp. TaxID=2184521 RepID=UPI003297D3A9